MVFNNFEIEISPQLDDIRKIITFKFYIQIDGKRVNEKNLTDIWGLVALLSEHKKKTYIWNCECGIPECGNIEPCNVIFSKPLNKLLITVPIPCCVNDVPDRSFSYWKQHHKQVTLKISREELAHKLWTTSLLIEEVMEKYTKEYILGSWPTHFDDREYVWPTNLPVKIRSVLTKNGYSF